MPANSAQRLYYDMIRALSGTSVMATVITAGNHDSQRFLEAPRALLETMNCFVAGESPESQAFVLRDDAGEPLLAVAAVPFLREGDVRGGSIDDTDATRAARFESGVRKHYNTVNGFSDEALDGARVPRNRHGAPVRDGSRLRPDDPTTPNESAYVGSSQRHGRRLRHGLGLRRPRTHSQQPDGQGTDSHALQRLSRLRFPTRTSRTAITSSSLTFDETGGMTFEELPRQAAP